MIHPVGATDGCWLGGELGIVGIMARVLRLRGAEWVEERRSVCAFIHSLTNSSTHPLICTADISQVPSVCYTERCQWGEEPS